MKFKQTFDLNRLRCDIGMKQALENWQTPKPWQKIKCPQCQSQSINFLRYLRQHHIYNCKDCQNTFKKRPKPYCSCSIPGQESKCQYCPYFEQFLTLVQQKTEKLKSLNQSELEALLDEI